jgi:hypothetical protein
VRVRYGRGWGRMMGDRVIIGVSVVAGIVVMRNERPVRVMTVPAQGGQARQRAHRIGGCPEALPETRRRLTVMWRDAGGGRCSVQFGHDEQWISKRQRPTRRSTSTSRVESHDPERRVGLTRRGSQFNVRFSPCIRMRAVGRSPKSNSKSGRICRICGGRQGVPVGSSRDGLTDVVTRLAIRESV